MYCTVLQRDTMFFGSTALIDTEMFNTLLHYTHNVGLGKHLQQGGSVRMGYCPRGFRPGG